MGEYIVHARSFVESPCLDPGYNRTILKNGMRYNKMNKKLLTR